MDVDIKLKASFIIVLLLALTVSAASAAAAECGSVPTDGCTVTQDTTFNPGTYNLPNGITITLSDIVLDCDGSVLNGSDLDDRSGIKGFDLTNITIKNCQLEHYDGPNQGFGIYLNRISKARIVNNTFRNVSFGVVFNGSDTPESKEILIEGNSFIRTRRDNLLLRANDSVVRGNIFLESTEENAIHIDGEDNLVEGSFFSDSILTFLAANLTIRNNTVKNTGISLVEWLGGGPIEDVRIYGNTIINGSISNGGERTSLCSGGLTNTWEGDYGWVETRRSMDLGQNCTYNLPNGIQIAADNIDLDCHGALINGANLWDTTGVTAHGHENVTVQGCTIQDYWYPGWDTWAGGTGISFEAMTNSRIFNNTIYRARHGIKINGSTGGRNLTIELNRVENLVGGEDGAYGIRMHANDSRLLNNTVLFSVSGYLISVGGSNNLIAGNVVARPQPSDDWRFQRGLFIGGLAGPSVNNTLIGNEVRNAEVSLELQFPEYTLNRAHDTLIVDNLLVNATLKNEGVNTKLCRGGVFNSFAGLSPLLTRTWFDIDPSCVWNLPAGMILDTVENATFDCRGALINGSNLETRSGMNLWFARNVTVENCRIRNFRPETENCCFAGIETYDIEDVTLRNLDINYTQIGVLLNGTGALRALLEDISVDQSARDGMDLVLVDDSVLRRIAVHRTGDNGINIFGERNVIEDSFFSQGVPYNHIISSTRNMTIRNNTFLGHGAFESGAVLLWPRPGGEALTDTLIVDNRIHDAQVAISVPSALAEEFMPDAGPIVGTTILNNLLDNSYVMPRERTFNTTLCRQGTFNRFEGESGIVTRIGMDLDPSCAWNLPRGIELEEVENATFDCHGAFINGTNDLDWAMGISGWGRPRNVTIRNCTIMNYNPPEMFGAAIGMNGEDITIEDNTIDNTHLGVIIDYGEKNYRVTIEDNTFLWTRGSNLVLDVDDSIIRGNTFLESAEGANLDFGGNNDLVEGNLFNGSNRHVYSGSLRNVTFRGNAFRGAGKTETTAIQFYLWPIEDVTIADNDIRDAYLALGDLSVMPEIIPVRLAMERNILDNVGRVEIPYWDDSTIAFNNITADSVNLSLTGSRVERNDFTGTGSTIVLAGTATMYANNAFNDAVMMRGAFNNTFTNNSYTNASFSLDSTTAENLLYENVFSGTQIGDAGVNNRWCKDNTRGNAYALGARYLGNDPKGGKCNAPPYFSENLSDKLVQVAERLYLRALCRDLENDSITYADNATEFDIGSSTGEIDWTPSDLHIGSRRVEVTCADNFSSVSQTFKIDVRGRRDAEVTPADFSFSDWNPQPGESVTIYATVRNVGDTALNGVAVNLSLDGQPLGLRTIPTLPHGGSYTVSAEWTATGDGFHLVKAVIDPEGLLEESNTGNNDATASLLVGTPPAEFGGILLYGGLSPSPVVQYGNVVVSGYAVYNTTFGAGEPVAGGEVTITVLEEPSISVTTHTVRGGTYSAVFRAPVAVGNYTVAVTITDLTFTKTIELPLEVVYPEIPEQINGSDLVVWSISVDPGQPIENRLANITALIRNIGNRDASAFNVSITDDRLGLDGTFYVEGLPAGAYHQIKVEWNATPKGHRTIRVFADSSYDVPEVNEGNNIKELSVRVWPEKPDLTPRGLTASDETPVVGQPFTVTRITANMGGGDATAFNFSVKDEETGRVHLYNEEPFLAGKGGFSSSSTEPIIFLDTKTHPFFFDNDPREQNAVDEDIETNNNLTIYITAHPPSIDLFIGKDEVWFSNGNPLDGTTITIYARVRNIGEVDSPGFTVSFNDSDSLIGTGYIPPLPAGQSNVTSITWLATPVGWHSIRVMADSGNAVPEWNEKNNLRVKNIYVSSPTAPALQILSEDIAFSNTNPDPGEQIIIQARVRNIDHETAYNVPVVFRNVLEANTTEPIIGSAVIPELPQGGSDTVSITWNAPLYVGSYVIKVDVDPSWTINESGLGKADNVATRGLIVGGIVDFAVFEQDIYFIDTPSMGEEGTLYVNISNIGSDTGNATVNISVDGIVFWTQQVDNLPGSSWTLLGMPFTPTRQYHNISVAILNVTPSEWYWPNNFAERQNVSFNSQPSIDISSQELYEDTPETINLSQYASDLDSDALFFTVIDENASLVDCEILGEMLTMAPALDWSGESFCEVQVDDSHGGVNTSRFTIVVLPMNDAPVLSQIGDQVALQNLTYTLVLSATDIDSPDLNFSANTTLFAVEKLNATHARVEFMPSWEQRGDHAVRFTVTDGELEDYEDIRFLVRGFRIDLKVEGQDAQAVKSGFANTTVRYNLSIENLGNTADIVSLSVDKQQEWSLRFLDENETEITAITVDSLATRHPFFEVDVPETTSPPDSNDILVVATSENGVVNDSVLTVTAVGGVPSVEITQFSTDKGSYRLTDTATVTVRVENTGGIVVKNLTVQTTIVNASGAVLFSRTEFIAELSTYQIYTYTTGFSSPGTHTLESVVTAQSGLEYDRRNTTFNVGLPFIESFTIQNPVYRPNSTERLTVHARNYDAVLRTVYVNYTFFLLDGSKSYYTSDVFGINANGQNTTKLDYFDPDVIGHYYADAVLILDGTDEVLDTATLDFWVTEAHFTIVDGITTDKNPYEAGEVVTIIGKVEDQFIPVEVNFTVRDPTGAVINRSGNIAVTARPNGEDVPYAFTLPADAQLGQWRIFGTVHKLGVLLHEYDGYFTVTSYDASEVIGSAGGTLMNPAGTMRLTIPPGALAGDTLVNITHNSAQKGYTLVSGNTAYGFSYDLFPKGAVFSQPVTLVMTYSDAEVGAGEGNLDIKLRNAQGNQWVSQNAVKDTVLNTLTLNVTEFRARAP